jgi:hypothetical protein
MASVRSKGARLPDDCMFDHPKGTFDCPSRTRYSLALSRYTSPYRSRSCTEKSPEPGEAFRSGCTYRPRCSETSPLRMIRPRRMKKVLFSATDRSFGTFNSAPSRSRMEWYRNCV